MTESTKLTKPRIEETSLPGVKLIFPKVFPDNRGFFCESYNIQEWDRELNFRPIFVQDNHSYSVKGVTRGMHIQPGMDKLVSCVSGEIVDFVVDIRPNSEYFGRHFGIRLSDKTAVHLWVPSGFAHGFQCLSDGAHVMYKCTDTHNAKTEFAVNPFDEALGIDWPLKIEDVIISAKDRNAPCLKDIVNLSDRINNY